MNQLQHIQQLFMDAMFNGSRDNPAINKLGEYLACKKHLSQPQQIAIYRNSIFGSLCNALAQIYPVCEKLVGEDFFNFMATKYISKHHSASPDLADYGENFCAFIADFKASNEVVYLADVARLEWAWHKAFHAADHNGLNIQQLAQASASLQQSLIFMLPPGSALIASSYPVDTIWLANQDDNDATQDVIHLDQGGAKLLVWRQHYDMRIDPLSDSEWLFLNAINRRQPFTEICNEFENNPQLDIATLMPSCVQRGWIADFSLGVIK